MKLIRSYGVPPFTVREYDRLGSTNDLLKSEAAELDDSSVAIAIEQTAGKGRLGRSFFSPGSGLYMSVLLKRNLTPEALNLLTPMTAVAVADALEELGAGPVGIKWVNDLYIGGKKVCGILTETGMSGAKPLFAVIGIGVNISEPKGGFPEEIKSKAGAAFNDPPKNIREALAEKILKRLDIRLKSFETRDFLPEYRQHSILIGRMATAAGRRGTVIGIDDDCRLVLKDKRGEFCISSGEAVADWENT